MYKFNIVKDSTELRKAIAENPELPIVVMTSYDAVEEDFYWTYCSIVHCEVGEVLNCEIPWREGLVYNSRTKFEDDLADYLSGTIDGANEMTDKLNLNIFWKYRKVFMKSIGIRLLLLR